MQQQVKTLRLNTERVLCLQQIDVGSKILAATNKYL